MGVLRFVSFGSAWPSLFNAICHQEVYEGAFPLDSLILNVIGTLGSVFCLELKLPIALFETLA
jgi:hypothetical protein